MCVCVLVCQNKGFFYFSPSIFSHTIKNLTCTWVRSSAGSSRHHVITQNEAVNSELFGQRKKAVTSPFPPTLPLPPPLRPRVIDKCCSGLFVMEPCQIELSRRKLAASTWNSIFFSPFVYSLPLKLWPSAGLLWRVDQSLPPSWILVSFVMSQSMSLSILCDLSFKKWHRKADC